MKNKNKTREKIESLFPKFLLESLCNPPQLIELSLPTD